MTASKAREAAIDAAMREMYSEVGPDESEIDVRAIRAILGRVYDKGRNAR
jgi:hypothetical protein